MEDTLKLEKDNLKIMKKFVNAVKAGDAYTASLLSREINSPVATLWKAEMYSKLGEDILEVENLIKCISDKSFKSYDPKKILFKLGLFFDVYNGLNVTESYENYFLKLFNDSETGGNLYKSEVIKEPLSLVELDGRVAYFEAIKLYNEGKYEEAIKMLKEVSESDGMYVRAKNFEALIRSLINDAAGALEILEYLITNFKFSFDTSSTYHKILLLVSDGSIKKMIENLKQPESDFDYNRIMVNSFIYMSEKMYATALKELERLSGRNVYNKAYLKAIAECYFEVQEYEKAKLALKQYVAIYPKNPIMRHALMNLERGQNPRLNEIDLFSVSEGLLEEMKVELINLMQQNILEDGTLEEQLYVFYLADFTKEEEILERIVQFFFGSNQFEYMLDALISLEVFNLTKAIIIEFIFKNIRLESFMVLANGKLKEVKYREPNLNETEDKERLEIFKKAYRDVYSMMLLVEDDEEFFLMMTEAVLNELLKMDLTAYPELLNKENNDYLISFLVAGFDERYAFLLKDEKSIDEERLSKLIELYKKVVKSQNIKVDLT